MGDWTGVGRYNSAMGDIHGWGLPESIKSRIGRGNFGRQRAIHGDGQLLVVLHKPPDGDGGGRDGVIFWRNGRGEWRSSVGETGSGAILRHVQVFADAMNSMAQDAERVRGLAELFDALELLTPLSRTARNLNGALQDGRETCAGDAGFIEAADLAYEVDRGFDLLLQDVRNDIHYQTAREAESHGKTGREALRASHRLNIMAAIFFPITAIAGLLGMNLSHGLDPSRPAYFWAVLVLGGILGYAAKSWVLGPGEETEGKGGIIKIRRGGQKSIRRDGRRASGRAAGRN